MPYPNEHAARLLSPDKFDKFRRTSGGKLYNKITVPKTIDIIWGHLKGKSPEEWAAQALRFDKKDWTDEEAKKWLKDNKIKFLSFEPADDKAVNDDDDNKTEKEEDKSKEEIADQDDDNDSDDNDDDDEKSLKSFGSPLWQKKHGELFRKTFDFTISKTEEKDIEGFKYGIVEGYASTYGNVDRGDDVVEKGAFSKSISEYKLAKKSIPMHFQHSFMDIIGDFPASALEDNEKGLFCKGVINLEVQRGREAYALLKQGALRSFSIGYTIDKHEIKENKRFLKQLSLWEISVVGVPMNVEAVVTSVKNIQPQNNQVQKLVCAKTLVELKKSNLEKILRKTGIFTRQAAKYLVSCLEKREKQKAEQMEQDLFLHEVKKLIDSAKQCDAVDNKPEVLDEDLQQIKLLLQKLK